jgi:hypothetical protein
MENIKPEELISRIERLEDHERIFIPLDAEFCREMKYINYKKTAYMNAINSFLTSSLEIVNEVGYEKIINDLAEITQKEYDMVFDACIAILGEELTAYFRDSKTKHNYHFDVDLQRLVIATGDAKPPCSCSDCAVGICKI